MYNTLDKFHVIFHNPLSLPTFQKLVRHRHHLIRLCFTQKTQSHRKKKKHTHRNNRISLSKFIYVHFPFPPLLLSLSLPTTKPCKSHTMNLITLLPLQPFIIHISLPFSPTQQKQKHLL